MFFVVMDWFEDGVDTYRGMKVIPIADEDVDFALFFAHDLAYNKETWEKYGKPHDVYIFHNDEGIFDEEDCFIASFLGCDKFCKNDKRRCEEGIPLI